MTRSSRSSAAPSARSGAAGSGHAASVTATSVPSASMSSSRPASPSAAASAPTPGGRPAAPPAAAPSAAAASDAGGSDAVRSGAAGPGRSAWSRRRRSSAVWRASRGATSPPRPAPRNAATSATVPRSSARTAAASGSSGGRPDRCMSNPVAPPRSAHSRTSDGEPVPSAIRRPSSASAVRCPAACARTSVAPSAAVLVEQAQAGADRGAGTAGVAGGVAGERLGVPAAGAQHRRSGPPGPGGLAEVVGGRSPAPARVLGDVHAQSSSLTVRGQTSTGPPMRQYVPSARSRSRSSTR